MCFCLALDWDLEMCLDFYLNYQFLLLLLCTPHHLHSTHWKTIHALFFHSNYINVFYYADLDFNWWNGLLWLWLSHFLPVCLINQLSIKWKKNQTLLTMQWLINLHINVDNLEKSGESSIFKHNIGNHGFMSWEFLWEKYYCWLKCALTNRVVLMS